MTTQQVVYLAANDVHKDFDKFGQLVIQLFLANSWKCVGSACGRYSVKAGCNCLIHDFHQGAHPSTWIWNIPNEKKIASYYGLSPMIPFQHTRSVLTESSHIPSVHCTCCP